MQHRVDHGWKNEERTQQLHAHRNVMHVIYDTFSSSTRKFYGLCCTSQKLRGNVMTMLKQSDCKPIALPLLRVFFTCFRPLTRTQTSTFTCVFSEYSISVGIQLLCVGERRDPHGHMEAIQIRSRGYTSQYPALCKLYSFF